MWFLKKYLVSTHIYSSVFLNAVLPLAPNGVIVELEYLPFEQVPVIPEFKRTIADVKCKDSLGRTFIVEMQMNWTDSFKQRLLFGTSQAIELAEESAYTPGELEVYETYWDSVRREKTLMVDKYAEGESFATHRIAKSLLKQGISIEIIMQSTGLNREEIEKLQKNH